MNAKTKKSSVRTAETVDFSPVNVLTSVRIKTKYYCPGGFSIWQKACSLRQMRFPNCKYQVAPDMLASERCVAADFPALKGFRDAMPTT